MVFAKQLEFRSAEAELGSENVTQIGGIVYEERSRRPIASAQIIDLGYERGVQVKDGRIWTLLAAGNEGR